MTKKQAKKARKISKKKPTKNSKPRKKRSKFKYVSDSDGSDVWEGFTITSDDFSQQLKRKRTDIHFEDAADERKPKKSKPKANKPKVKPKPKSKATVAQPQPPKKPKNVTSAKKVCPIEKVAIKKRKIRKKRSKYQYVSDSEGSDAWEGFTITE